MHNPENIDLTKKLDGLVSDFADGYKSLQQNVGQYLIDSQKHIRGQDRINQTSIAFIPLRRAQLQELFKRSENLGIPLSPLGILTFTSGALIQMNLDIQGSSHLDDIGGNFIESAYFQQGPSSRAWFWIAHSPAAGKYTQAEIDKYEAELAKNEFDKAEPSIDEDGVQILQGYPASVIPEKIFSPLKVDARKLHEHQDHEAFHGVHMPLVDDMTTFGNFDKILLEEGLAFRTSLLLKIRTIDGIKKSLLEFYFADKKLTSTQLSNIDQFLKIISQSLDPQYQGEITWRGVCCKYLEEFLNPSPELLSRARSMLDYSQKVAIPRYKAGLGL